LVSGGCCCWRPERTRARLQTSPPSQTGYDWSLKICPRTNCSLYDWSLQYIIVRLVFWRLLSILNYSSD
jgi:hypothetical protein